MIPALLLAGGIIFLLVGLSLVLEQYQPVHAAPPPAPGCADGGGDADHVPTVVTPCGIAALIVLLANSHDGARTASILAILIGVLVLNLLAMLYARRMMGGATAMVLQVLGLC